MMWCNMKITTKVCGTALMIGLLASFFFIGPDAYAYQIKRVIRGSHSMAINDEIAVVDFSAQLGGVPLDLAKSFILSSRGTGMAKREETDFLSLIDDHQALVFLLAVKQI